MNIFFPQTSRGEKYVGIIVLRVFSNKVEEQRARKWGGKVARFGLFEWKINVGEEIGVEEEEVLLQSEANLIWNRISDQIRWLGFSFSGLGSELFLTRSLHIYGREFLPETMQGIINLRRGSTDTFAKKKFFSAEISAHKSIFLSLSLEKRKWEMGRKREKQSKFSNYSDVFSRQMSAETSVKWPQLRVLISRDCLECQTLDQKLWWTSSCFGFGECLRHIPGIWRNSVRYFSIRTKRKQLFFWL